MNKKEQLCLHRIKTLCLRKDCDICLAKSFASHPKSKYWIETNQPDPRHILGGSGKIFWFSCHICVHNFQKSPHKITTMNRWCPFCANQKLCLKKDCDICFAKSFASHPKSKYWIEIGPLGLIQPDPRNIFSGSGKIFWFNCHICDHNFQKSPQKITRMNRWCPFCANQKLCSRKDCDICFEKSFASHEKSKYWSSKNILQPRNIFPYSNQNIWFNCNKCKHEFETALQIVTTGSWCSFCANQKLCLKDCDMCFDKSFASHEKANFWSSKNKAQPRNVFRGTGEKYWFDCHICSHSFKSILYNITNGGWCPSCKNKTERKLHEWLVKTYSYKVIKEYKPLWCKNSKTNKDLPFDFFIKDLKLIVELDGPQHFKQVQNWKSPTLTRNRDIYKMKQAITQGVSVVRILQEDVYKDKNNWEKNLKSFIKTYQEPTIIYLCQNDEYFEYPSLLNINIL